MHTDPKSDEWINQLNKCLQPCNCATDRENNPHCVFPSLLYSHISREHGDTTPDSPANPTCYTTYPFLSKPHLLILVVRQHPHSCHRNTHIKYTPTHPHNSDHPHSPFHLLFLMLRMLLVLHNQHKAIVIIKKPYWSSCFSLHVWDRLTVSTCSLEVILSPSEWEG